MKRGWIKVWRKTLENDIWRYDRTAWFVFEYILLRTDKETGAMKSAYSTMSEFLGVPKGTLHKAILRLKKAKMVNDVVNAKYTTFYICKWKEYQGDGERLGERKVNAKETQSEHIQEYKNKEYDDRTLKLAEYLKIKPTDIMNKYATEVYADFKFKEPTLLYLANCEKKNLVPCLKGWASWMKLARDKYNELEAR